MAAASAGAAVVVDGRPLPVVGRRQAQRQARLAARLSCRIRIELQQGRP
jgi:hypothetical protein